MINIRDSLKTEKQAVIILLFFQIVISMFWLFYQGGFFLVKDTATYLAIATRAAEIPFGADCFDRFPSSSFIAVHVAPYAYMLNLLNKLPGGFVPYHFLISQIFHFSFIMALFYAARLWQNARTSTIIALLCMFEPYHHVDILTLKQSLFTQATIGISLALALYSWKKKRTIYLVFSALSLGFGYIFRTLNMVFLPLVIVFAILSGRTPKYKIINLLIVLIIIGLASIPNYLYYRANPHLKVNAIDTASCFFIIRFHQIGYLTSDHLPETMSCLYSLAPRLRDQQLVERFKGTSVPLLHAFRHERIYRYNDSPSEAMGHMAECSRIAIREAFFPYLKWGIMALLQNFDVGYKPKYFHIPYRIAQAKSEDYVIMEKWGNELLRTHACSLPFEQAMSIPPPVLISEDLIRSLENMPRPKRLTLFLGQTWESASPFKGIFALILVLYSFLLFISRKHWDILLFSGGAISIYLFIVSYLSAMTTNKFIMALPWFVWTIGMAFTEKVRDKSNYSENYSDPVV